MSRRTSAANKAIAKAWENERNNVLEGKGTREWTPEQQRDILDRGKAYDENGRAFEGQHMKSVGEYPEYQGEPGNIQFLTREEHLEAHLGSWQNPTNWYYDPVTKEKVDFGSGPFTPCKIKELKNPVVTVTKPVDDPKTEKAEQEAASEETPKISSDSNRKGACSSKASTNTAHNDPSVLSKVGHVFKGIGGFAYRNRGVIKTVGKGVAGLAVTYILGKLTGGNSESGGGNSGSADSDSLSEGGESFERSFPCEHDVSGYTRRQNGKEVHVRPYKRGGRKNE